MMLIFTEIKESKSRSLAKTCINILKNIALTLSAFFAMPNFAFANTVVGKIIGYGCDWLSGEIGVGIGTLVIIYSGFQMLEGHIELRTLVSRGIGVGIMVGGAYIASDVFHIGSI